VRIPYGESTPPSPLETHGIGTLVNLRVAPPYREPVGRTDQRGEVRREHGGLRRRRGIRAGREEGADSGCYPRDLVRGFHVVPSTPAGPWARGCRGHIASPGPATCAGIGTPSANATTCTVSYSMPEAGVCPHPSRRRAGLRGLLMEARPAATGQSAAGYSRQHYDRRGPYARNGDR